MDRGDAYSIRPFRRRDAAGVRAVCIETAWRGLSAAQFLEDPAIWADLWTGYFLDREPENCWVVTGPDSEVAGYLTGCADSPAAERFQAGRVLPRIALRALLTGQWARPMNRRFFVRTIRAARRGQLAVPARLLRDYPAHFHFNLLPPARGLGLGGSLHDLYERRMRALGRPGMHVQVLGSNGLVNAFNLRRGYRVAHRSRVPSLDGYLEDGPVELVVYVKRLSGKSE